MVWGLNFVTHTLLYSCSTYQDISQTTIDWYLLYVYINSYCFIKCSQRHHYLLFREGRTSPP